jgi:tetratricopeptide (TPR) repeat protein
MQDVSPAEEDIFNAARQIQDRAARLAYLQQACAVDAELLERVRALLGAHEGPGSFLDAPASSVGLVPHFRAALCLALPGATVGRYTLVRLIGEGSFGWVYEAEQRHPVRTLALKILKAGMDSPQVVARFEAERQALALMDHPNIAKILDTGATDAGRPYFVMELIEGIPITRYCDEQRLPLRERLELFIQVCRAVQHAHTKGVIHRDLKPSNVLVATYDDKPVPKVIDFGVAKATGPALPETMHTGFGHMIGTLAYMSPEQAELNRPDADTRTDVYSLGVLLYELLTGTTPLTAARLKEAVLLDALRAIREEEPPWPSTRLGTIAASHGSAGNRDMDLKKLSRSVKGELDWIVMKCLEKDRTRRYETADAVARDIERHLNDEPVAARPAGGTYRFRKFVRRHRVGVAAGVVVALALLVGAGGATVGMLRANSARIEEAEQRAEADAARADTEEVNRFLVDMLKSARRGDGQGEQVLVRDVLDAAAQKLDQGSLKSRPRTEATVRLTLGGTYDSLNLHAAAETQLRRALELRRAELGEVHLEVADCMNRLAWSLASTGELARVEPLVRQSVGIGRKLAGPDHPGIALRVAGYLDLLATVLDVEGKPAESEAAHREALGIRRTTGTYEPDVATSLEGLANVLMDQGRLAEAEPLYLQSLEIRRRIFGETNLYTLFSVGALARLYAAQSRFDEAEALQRRMVAGCRESLGPYHPETLSAVHALDLLRVKQGRVAVDAVRAELRERLQSTITATSAQLERTGTANPRAAAVLAARGQSYARLSRIPEAIADYARTIELDPSDHFTWFELGGLLARAGERERFAAHCRLALERFGGTTDRTIAERMAKMVACVPAEFSGVGPQHALDLADGAVADGAAHLDMKWFVLTKGIAEYRAGHFDSAAAWLRKAEESGAGWRTVQARFYLAMALHRLGRHEEALTSLRNASGAMDADDLKLGWTELGHEHRHLTFGWIDLGYEYVTVCFTELARDEAEALLGVHAADRNEVSNEAMK